MGKRPRIKKTLENIESTQIFSSDSQTTNFSQNCSTPNAKLVHKYTDFEIEIWIDEHYGKRESIGDENGLRLGIEMDKVINLIIDSVKFIFHFYMTLRLTNLINFYNRDKPTKHRIVVKDFRVTDVPLNIVIEVHFLDYSKYEITVITAMKCENFKMSDGQIFMSLTENGVNLNRLVQLEGKSISKISI